MTTPQPPVLPLDEQAIQKRLEAATKGPWTWIPKGDGGQPQFVIHPDNDGGVLIAKVTGKPHANAALIVHAPEDLRALLQKMAQMREQLEKR